MRMKRGFIVPCFWFVFIASLVCAPHGFANTYLLERIDGSFTWNGEYWVPPPNCFAGSTVTVVTDNGSFVRAESYHNNSGMPGHIALYTTTKKATLKYALVLPEATATWRMVGDPTINGSITGTEFDHTIALERTDISTTIDTQIHVQYTYEAYEQVDTNEDGSPVFDWVPYTTSLYLGQVKIWIFKKYHADLTWPAGGFQYKLNAYQVTPTIYVHPDGNRSAQFGTSALLADCNVRLEKKEDGGLLHFSEEWFSTGTAGYVPVRFLCPTDAFSGEGTEFVSETVAIKAVKDGCEMEGERSVSIPFAVAANVQRAGWYDPLSGEVSGTIIPGNRLNRGDKVQIGTLLAGGSLGIEFCDGTRVILSAELLGGFLVTIGDGEVDVGSTLVWLDLREKVQDWRDDPRRMLRMQVYKAIGGALDTTLKIPKIVGFAVKTPGGKVEKCLAKFCESAYETSTPPRSSHGLRLPLDAAPQPLSGDGRIREALRTDFIFYTDGTSYIENMGGNVRLSMEGGTQETVIPAAAAGMVWIDPHSSDVVLSAPATSSTAWNAGAPGAWTFSPTDSATVTSRTPNIAIAGITANAWAIETARVRLDGRDIGGWLAVQTPPDGPASLTGGVPAGQPLAPGSHTLSMSCLTLGGQRVVQQAVFTVDAPSDAPAAPAATPFAEGVWLSWWTVPGAEGYRVWRAASEDGERTLLTAVPRTQPGFLDAAPLPENWYWVGTVDAGGQAGQTAPALTCAWSAALPAAAAVGGVSDFRLTETAEGVRVSFDASARPTTRWKLERVADSGGDFVMLDSGEETVADEYIDPTVTPGEAYTYRLTPLKTDGTAGEPQTASITTGTVPAPMTGLEAFFVEGGAALLWDAFSDFRAEGIRVYRSGDGGESYQLAATLAATATNWVDSAAGGVDACLYQVRGYGAGGESDALTVGVAFFQTASEAAVIAMASATASAKEGDGAARVTVTRGGNLAEAVAVTYDTGWSSASQDQDYAATAGTLLFAPGQTAAEIVVPLLPDDEYEGPETFHVYLRSTYGAAEIGTVWYTTVSVDDSDVFIMDDYQDEITVNENDANAWIWIERVVPSSREVSVELAVADDAGTAVPGTDYVAFEPQRVFFASNETRKAVAVALLDDAIKDGTKRLNVELRNPWGGACVSDWNTTLTVIIRDDDTRPGQLVPNVPGGIVQVPAGQDSVQIPIQRIGGTDGTLRASVFTMGGTLPWGAISAFPVSLAEGVTSSAITVTLNRTGLDTRIAPFTVLEVINDEYPNEIYQVPILFRHADASGAAWQAWTASHALGALSGIADDPDGDGFSNIEEFALGTDPSQAASCPQPQMNVSGGLELLAQIRSDPNLAVLGQFTDDLVSGDKTYDAGWWDWDDGQGLFSTSYARWAPQGVNRMFGHLVFFWLGD